MVWAFPCHHLGHMRRLCGGPWTPDQVAVHLIWFEHSACHSVLLPCSSLLYSTSVNLREILLLRCAYMRIRNNSDHRSSSLKFLHLPVGSLRMYIHSTEFSSLCAWWGSDLCCTIEVGEMTFFLLMNALIKQPCPSITLWKPTKGDLWYITESS